MTDDEISKVARDAFKHGTGFMRDGKHVPLEDVYMTAGDVATDDLVKRLRDLYGANVEEFQTIGEAADRIESQMQLIGASGEAIGTMLARIEKMEEALREIIMLRSDTKKDLGYDATKAHEIARAALGGKKDG